MRSILFLVLLFKAATSFAQVDRMKIADSITKEAKRLYKSEMASWYGTDVFMEEFKSEAENIGGYFSYDDNESYICVFFSKDENPQVIGTIKFQGSYDPKKAKADGTKRQFSKRENEFYQLRKITSEEVNKDTSFFEKYKNTNYNIIPLINENQKLVYILTGTSRPDIVIIGNDYLLAFDQDNNLISKRKLHANILSLPMKVQEEEGKAGMGSVHNHVPETGDFITATDLCTFMLYEQFSDWKQQMVISEKYMSIWNCKTDKLIIIPTH